MPASSYTVTGGSVAIPVNTKSPPFTITLNAPSEGENVTVEVTIDVGTQPLLYIDGSLTPEVGQIVVVEFALGETVHTFEIEPRTPGGPENISFVNNFSAEDFPTIQYMATIVGTEIGNLRNGTTALLLDLI